MNTLRLFRQGNGSTRRLQARRRPIVEDLEGRQLLSGIQGNHIGVVAEVQRSLVADSATGKHLDTAAIQGAHIGTAAIQGNHIGSPAIVVAHIGTNAIYVQYS